MEKSFLTWTAAALGTAILLTACNTNTGTTAPGSKVKLDPSKPVSLTVWHYYNGAQQAAFDQLVSEFNATEGKDKGIYVEGYTQGSVSGKGGFRCSIRCCRCPVFAGYFLYLRRYCLCSTERG
jgi:maltose-binding protein MalE